MLHRIAYTCALRCSQTARPTLVGLRCLSSGQGVNPAKRDRDDQEIVEVRKWLASFNADTIPRSLCDVSFSRSSGPGGQNVNKLKALFYVSRVNSKATLRIPLQYLLPLLPRLLHQGLQSSRFYAPNANAIVIQADSSRKQSDNVQECFRKLHGLINEAGREAVPGETSAEQKERVKELKKAENKARVRAKKIHSNKKAARSSRGDQ